jgi:hypothetical protein
LFFVPGWLSILFRRESCIRRDSRHEPVRIGCRIHPETWLPVRRVSRLAELDEPVQDPSTLVRRGAGSL